MLKVIIDFDGTLTVEEEQARPLADKSLDTLAGEILSLPRQRLAADYDKTQARLLAAPDQYWWEVNGLIASYCDEGAFILNTTTLQVMLRENPAYAQAVAEFFPHAEYDPVVDCTNYLFHRHTAELPPVFRPGARELLAFLQHHPALRPVVLTNSLGDKVRRFLGMLSLDGDIDVLGDTRQYDMDPNWRQHFPHPELGQIQVWPLAEGRQVDLRRPVYYQALLDAASDGSCLAVVADTFSLPGALPLLMRSPFFLLRTPYTPRWCLQVVEAHPLGQVLGSLVELPERLTALYA
ncbi:MAG: haloacid dehalogenase-like hydrolase [Anaerolineae bacterium]|nr:haloacid dehalogenase-like hydrolase [Anaerolineae bacterium]